MVRLTENLMLRISILMILAIISITTAMFVTTYQQQKEFEMLKQLPATRGVQTDDGVIDGRFVVIWKMNPHIIGWIQVPGTTIDYPVMQRVTEPTYYLRRNFKREYSRGGTPFMSSSSRVSGSDPGLVTANWLIYGHNMHDGTMFHDLVKYKDKRFYEEHPRLCFDTIYEGGRGNFQVIAVVKAVQGGEKDFDYEQYAGITQQAAYEKYVREVKARSLYETGRTATYGQQLVTLSTCEYSQRYGRLYIVAAKVERS